MFRVQWLQIALDELSDLILAWGSTSLSEVKICWRFEPPR